MNYSCESFLDYAYEGEEALEGFHPIKGLQNLFTKLIATIQKLLNRIRGLRAIYVPKMYLNDFQKIVKAFRSSRNDIQTMIKNKDFSKIDELEKAIKLIENSNLYGGFVNMDTSIFGKDDYVIIENGKDIIQALNYGITTITTLKTQLNSNPETAANVRKNASAVIKYYNLEISIFTKILKFHPPLKDPKNVNKLGGVGNATVYA